MKPTEFTVGAWSLSTRREQQLHSGHPQPGGPLLACLPTLSHFPSPPLHSTLHTRQDQSVPFPLVWTLLHPFCSLVFPPLVWFLLPPPPALSISLHSILSLSLSHFSLSLTHLLPLSPPLTFSRLSSLSCSLSLRLTTTKLTITSLQLQRCTPFTGISPGRAIEHTNHVSSPSIQASQINFSAPVGHHQQRGRAGESSL